MKARWYQQEALESFINYDTEIGHGRPLIVCPTGSGKSLIIALIVNYLLENGHRVLVLSHVQEIIQQNAAALCRIIPPELVGVYAAGLGKKERKIVTVATITSIYKKADFFKGYDYILVDEAHAIPPNGEGRYLTFLGNMEHASVIGLTATPYRMGTGYLYEHPENNPRHPAIFDSVIYEVDLIRLIREGYLSRLRSSNTKTALDTTGVRKQGGDFSEKELSERFDKDEITADIVGELEPYKQSYKSWLVFAIDTKHCDHIAALMNERGIVTASVHTNHVRDARGFKRDEAIRAFKQGRIQAVVSVATMTTGFDHPEVDLIVILRPTMSPNLHVQIIGRGLRIAPKKDHCLILDFARNIDRLGPINNVKIKIAKGDGDGPPIVKSCPECGTHCPGGARNCYHCGAVFPEPEPEISVDASSSEVVEMETEEEIKINHLVNSKLYNETLLDWYIIKDIIYEGYTTLSRNYVLRVTYVLDNKKRVREYVNPLAAGRKGYRDKHWWKIRSHEPVPSSMEEIIALAPTLRKPVMLKVSFTGDYPAILNYSFRS